MFLQKDCDDKNLSKPTRGKGWKPYSKPVLKEYGHIKELTGGAIGTKQDFGSTKKS
jgi:hypothetical protein